MTLQVAMLNLDAFGVWICIILFLLVVRGYSPHLITGGDSEKRTVALGVTLFLGSALMRVVWWDFGQIAAWWLGITPMPPRTAFWSLFNLCSQSVLASGMLCFLRLLHLTIPESEKHDWSWLSAPFYPRKIYISLTRK